MSFQAYIDNIKEKTGKTPKQMMETAKKDDVSSKEMYVLPLECSLINNLICLKF